MPNYSLKDANFRVFLDSRQGGRKYMEDVVCIREHKSENGEDDFVFFAVFDGHGGGEAARFAREHLLPEIKNQKGFWTDDQEQVSRAIQEAFLSTHRLMWKCVGSWPKTVTGLPSTSGTTASIVLIKNSKMYIAHVGDSSIVLGEEKASWQRYIANLITEDHKPESPAEKKRIEESGGQVVSKAGVQRVVWHRPKPSHQGPVRRSTHIDDIPFLAVARALGDLWSYNSQRDTFVVSPDPDIAVVDFNPNRHKFIVLASDGLWNMVRPEQAVSLVEEMEVDEVQEKGLAFTLAWNPARKLVSMALDRWAYRHMRADNTSVIVVMIDPPSDKTKVVPVSRTESRVSSSSTIQLSDPDSEVCGKLTEFDPELGASVDLGPIETESPHASRYWNLAPSPHHIGFGRSTAVHTAKHIHAISGMTPHQVFRHPRPKTPKSAPSKLHSAAISGKCGKSSNMYKSPSMPAHRTSSYKISPLVTSHSSIGAASPVLPAAIKRKASAETSECSISKISPLQSPADHGVSPVKRKASLSLDCFGAATKKQKLNKSPQKDAEPERRPKTVIVYDLDNDEVEVDDEYDVAKLWPKEVESNESEMDMTDVAMTCTVQSGPKTATSARSPLKVDTCQQNSPSMALVSPIWPSCLDKDIDLNSASDDACDFPASGKKVHCVVLSENSTTTKSMHKTNYTRLAKKLVGSQNLTSKSSIKRKSPTQGTRITVHKLKLRSKRPTKLRANGHRTRLQVKAAFSLRRS